jgi:hypothetical protein
MDPLLHAYILQGGGDKGCTVQLTKKYQTRDSPPYPANECCGMTFMGNDGRLWISSQNGGQKSCTWKPLEKKSPRKSIKRSTTKRAKKKTKKTRRH